MLVAVLLPVPIGARPVATGSADEHGDGCNGSEADVDRRGPGRPDGGVGPWTDR
jgi:hypothetical protein